MKQPRTYVGVDNDMYGGMTSTGVMIRDAWVFGLLPRSETCEGWSAGRLQLLYDQVYEAWAPYGHLASRLPPDLAEQHRQIHDEAIARAQELGWEPSADDNG